MLLRRPTSQELFRGENVLSAMKSVTLLLLFVPLCALAADISGDWNAHLSRFDEDFAGARITLKTEGAAVSGTLNELKLSGTFEGDQLHLTATRPDGKEWGKLDGRLQGNEITGTMK